MPSVRLLVAETGLGIYESILQDQHALAGVELIGSVRYPDEALAATRRFRPTLVLLDAAFAGEDWRGLVPQLKTRAGGPEIVICTTPSASVDLQEALAAGVLALIEASDVVAGLAALLARTGGRR